MDNTANVINIPGPIPTEVTPTPVEPTPVEPTPVEPTPVEPTPVEPTPVEPTPEVIPTPVEPAPVEPAPVEPAPVEPTPEVTPTPVEPAPVEPAPVEPTPIEPAPVEPAPEVTPDTSNVIPHNTHDGAQPLITRKKVVFALPGDNFSSKFLISWTSTISKLWDLQKYDIMISPATGSYVPFVRMHTLGLDVLRGVDQKPFNNQHFDVWVTIDSDIIFTPEQIIDLIESTDIHPVVAGMYRMSDLTNYAFVKEWDSSHYLKEGTFKFSSPTEIEEWKKETDLKYMPVAYSGMGFMAVKKEVIDKMQYPYFYSPLEEFVKEDGTIIRDICSEDVAFSKNIRSAGYEIMINTDIRVGHNKSLVI